MGTSVRWYAPKYPKNPSLLMLSKSMCPHSCATDDTFTMRFRPGVRKTVGMRRDVSAKWPWWFTPICISRPSSVVSRFGNAMTPALFIRTSRRPYFSSNAAANRSTEDNDARSSVSDASTSAPGISSAIVFAAFAARVASRHAMTTLYPGFFAISFAAMKPRPVFAPVMTQTFAEDISEEEEEEEEEDAARTVTTPSVVRRVPTEPIDDDAAGRDDAAVPMRRVIANGVAAAIRADNAEDISTAKRRETRCGARGRRAAWSASRADGSTRHRGCGSC